MGCCHHGLNGDFIGAGRNSPLAGDPRWMSIWPLLLNFYVIETEQACACMPIVYVYVSCLGVNECEFMSAHVCVCESES